MKTKYIFLLLDIDMNSFFYDLSSDELSEEVKCYNPYVRMNTRIGKFVEKVSTSYKIRKLIPFNLCKSFYTLEHLDFDEDTNYVIVAQSQAINLTRDGYFRYFKNKHRNVKLYALLIDSLHAHSTHLDLVRSRLLTGVFDRVLTYDKYDAQEYGFDWFGYCYYSDDLLPLDSGSKSEKCDLYYIGRDKFGRNDIVYDIFEKLSRKNVKCRFDIPKPEKPRKYFQYMTETEIPYKEVLQRAAGANCILEVLMPGQETQTLRYMEAVVYNKKLISNNKHLSELPYYDERFMKYFSKVEDIDFEWVKRRETVNYGYRGGGAFLRSA